MIFPEWMKALVGALVRWALMGLLTLLVTKGYLSDQHLESIIGAVTVAVLVLIWSLLSRLRLLALLKTALDLPADATLAQAKQQTRLRSQLAQAAGERIATRITKLPVVLLAFALAASALTVGCDESKTARKFALNTDRIAGYTAQTIRVADEMERNGTISTAAALALTQGAQQVNAVNRQLVTEAAKYLVDDGHGKKVLRFTEEGKVNIGRIVASLQTVANGLAADPSLFKLEPAVRERFRLITAGVATSANTLALIVAAIKVAN